jgi:hypothetical protein
MHRNSCNVFDKLNAYRGIITPSYTPNSIWEHFFTNMNINEDMIISIVNDGTEKKAIFSKERLSFNSPLNQKSTESSDLCILNDKNQNDIAENYPLKLIYCDGNITENSYFTISESRISLSHEQNIISNSPHIQYLKNNSSLTQNELSDLFGSILSNEQKQKITDALRFVEPKVKDFTVITSKGINNIYINIGLKISLPINILGDGINKLIQIISIMYKYRNSLILIENIENNFYSKYYRKVWKLLFNTSKETNCQILATSNSYEFIERNPFLYENKQDLDYISVIRLQEKDDGIIYPIIIKDNALEYIIENNWEIR